MRAAEAGQVLRSLARANPVLADEPLRDDVADVWEGIASGIDDLRLTGVDARVSGRLPDATPRQVRAALVAATREALSNVQRHAHATNARVRITRSSQQDGSLHVRIVITDDGTGFNPALTSQGFGIDHAIQGSMLSVGGNAHLTSSAEKGTRVELEWPSPTPASQGESSFSAAAVRSVAVPVLASMWLFSALSLVSTIGRVQTPGLDLAAFIAYSMLVLIVVNQAQHGFLRWPVVLAVTVAAPFVYRLQEASLGPSLQDPWSEWSSEALVALMFVTTATGPLWAWTIVLASWLFMQGDVLTELTQPGTAVIAAGAILGLSLHRSVRDYQLNSREFVIARGSVDATRAVAQSLAARYASVAESGVLDLLERVADGAIDPSSPVVQEACRLHERHIRSLMRLDPARREFDRALIVLSDLACTRGVLIDVVVPDGLPDLGGDVLTARPGPFDLVELMERGASARITAHMDRDRISLRFVGRCPGFSKMAETEVQGGSIVMVDDDTQTFMWEVILDAPGDR